MTFQIWTDGASRGNPGKSGIGGIIKNHKGLVIDEVSEYVGIQTNNYAEYKALEITLKRALELNIRSVDVFMDSKLVVEQLNGNWKVLSPTIKVLYGEIILLTNKFESITFTHILRHLNKEADLLANKAIDLYEIEN